MSSVNNNKQSLLNNINPVYLAGFAGLIVGFLIFGLIRFFAMEAPVHYHANFGVFINGQREEFDNALYYEEVAACSVDAAGPRQRVHLHQPDSDVVHVHDEAATWGNLFENIGWSLGNNFVRTTTDFYIESEESQLSFLLNGESTRSISNVVIGDEDILLISYGSEDTELQEQYDQIRQNAGEFNVTADPGACSGSDEASLIDRLKRII